MKYEEIFNKVSGGDTISLYQYSAEHILSKNPGYVLFCNAKIKLRKELEKEYKPMLRDTHSFRVYLESLVGAILNNTDIYAGYDSWFGDQSEKAKNEMTAKIKTFFSHYPSIEEDMLSFIWNDDNYINECFSKIGLKPFYVKGALKDLFQLKNGQVGLTMFFRLNEESRKIFVERIVDDWGEKIGQFQDAAICEGDKALFSSITHEDWYFF